ncbi:MAG: beta-ketoacyl synthase N-terminal-like domain-containing protein [Dysgonomonas sp.]
MSDIAIIGLSCLMPDAKNYNEFWDNLILNKSSIREADKNLYGDEPSFYKANSKGQADRCYCTKGGFIPDITLDTTNFLIPSDEIEKMDDMYKWALSTASEALDDSGYRNNADVLANTGLVLANLSFPTKYSNQLFVPIYYRALTDELAKVSNIQSLQSVDYQKYDNISLNNRRISGFSSSFISRAIGLSENHFTIDAACASSLYSIKLASDYLSRGKARMMLAGSVSGADPLFVSMGFSIFQALPGNQETRPFDADSQGLIPSQGAGFFVLKQLEDAIQDHDKIYAVIKGIGLSNDGRGVSVLSPRAEGQVLAFERAYKDGLDADNIQYIECHATGTPLGDQIELDSIEQFFGTKSGPAPHLGSVKSNIGHALTSAGTAALIKVILGMKNGVIPATINIQNPISSKNKLIGGKKIVSSNIAWPQKGGKAKYAAINSFGFGGSNAHLVISDSIETNGEVQEKRKPLSQLAIVGMSMLCGGCKNLEEFYHSIYQGKQHFSNLKGNRWRGFENDTKLLEEYGLTRIQLKGAFIDAFEIDYLKLKIPPNEEDRLIPQQLLMLKTADDAIKNACLKEGRNVAVIVAMETELSLHQYRGRINILPQSNKFLIQDNADNKRRDAIVNILKDSLQKIVTTSQYTSYIGNIMACRIASLWNFSGPAFTISAEENSVFKALEIAQILLDNNEVEAVVIGAVDLSAGFENILLKNKEYKLNSDNYSISIEKDANGWLIGEGSGAIVVKKIKDAEEKGDTIYSTIESINFSRSVSKQSIKESLLKSIDAAKINASDIGYVEYSSIGIARYDRPEIEAISEIFVKDKNVGCTLGSIKSNVGSMGVASGIAAIVKNALCLFHQFIPPVPNWSSSKYPEITNCSSLNFPIESYPWLSSSKNRYAAISNISLDGIYCSVVMKDYRNHVNSIKKIRQFSFPYLLICCNDSLDSLLDELNILYTTISENNIRSIIASNILKYNDNTKGYKYRIALVGNNKDCLKSEIESALINLKLALSKSKQWISVKGSCCYERDNKCKPKVGFVYPGGYNSYVGLGKDIFQLFPELSDLVQSYTSDIGDILHKDIVYPKTQKGLKETDFDNLNKEFSKDSIAMFENGISMSVLYTLILTKVLGVIPDTALGYSMGEVSMLYSLGVWGNSEEMSKRLRNSSVFNNRLAGNMDVLREIWNIGPDEKEIWCTYVVKTSVETLNTVISNYSKVFLLLINTEKELIIAGNREQCTTLIEELNCLSFEITMSDTVHCDIAKIEYDNLKYLHESPVNKINNINFYTASSYSKFDIDSKIIAENIAIIYGKTINFPQLINTVYDDGVGVFIEVGARNNCSSWIDEILGQKEHLVMPVNQKGVPDRDSIIRLIAKLFSYGINLNLKNIYPSADMDEEKPSLIRETLNGGQALTSVLSSESNKRLLRELPGDITEKNILDNNIYTQKVNKNSIVNKNIIMEEKKNKNSIPPSPLLENLIRITELQINVLKSRHKSIKTLGNILTNNNIYRPDVKEIAARRGHPQISVSTEMDSHAVFRNTQNDTIAFERKDNTKSCVWDSDDLLEFASGNISKIFGPEYAVIDTYARRVRLPMPPYLLVSRVTKIDAKMDKYEPCSMITEYDIPYNAWFSREGQIPWAVSVESGQCDLLLISYLGVDFQNKGKRVYRLLDSTLTFLDTIPKEGETLRYEIKINSFARSGESLLFFFSYDCFVGDKKILVMTNGCAGFFSNEELQAGKGVVYSEKESEVQKNATKLSFAPLITSTKTSFGKRDLIYLVNGDIAKCFGDKYLDINMFNPKLSFATEEMLMLDTILNIDIKGGHYGIGYIVAEKKLYPGDWYFPCHFKDDQVLAGSLMAEGCAQLLKFYLSYIGLPVLTTNAQFEPIPDKSMKVRCRGQVTPQHSSLKYLMYIKEIGVSPSPYAIADVEILCEDKIVVYFEDLGMQLHEKNKGLISYSKNNVLFDEEDITQFAKGSIAKCFGDEYKIYDNRQAPRTPNGDLQLISRVIKLDATKRDFKKISTIVSEYDVPSDAWYFTQRYSQNEIPYSILMEIALQPCGFLSAYMGSSFIYSDVDFYFRNLDGDGTILKKVDVRGKTITNTATLLSTNAFANTIIQSFKFELSVGNEVFYTGSAVFGYFSQQALKNQSGLNQSERTNPYLRDNHLQAKDTKTIVLKAYYESGRSDKYYFDLLQSISINENKGQFDRGYVLAHKSIEENDWFFRFHFFGDPVMPGSLGVEAIIQGALTYCLETSKGKNMNSPNITIIGNNKISWKYRGQLTPEDKRMDIEIDIKEVYERSNRIDVSYNASVWKENIKIYEVTNITMSIND